MAKKNDTAFFENKLLDFVTTKDPMLEMLQWVMDKFMEIEVAHSVSVRRKTLFWGAGFFRLTRTITSINQHRK